MIRQVSEEFKKLCYTSFFLVNILLKNVKEELRGDNHELHI